MDNSSSSVSSSRSDESDSSSIVSDSEFSHHSEKAPLCHRKEDREADDDEEEEEDIDDEEWGVQLEIVVKRVGKGENDVVVLNVDPSASVLDLKNKISDELEAKNEPIPPSRQRLIFSGRMLQNGDGPLSDLKMKEGVQNIVHLAPLPPGAVPSARSVPAAASPISGSLNRQRGHHVTDGSSRAHHLVAEQRRQRRRTRNRDHPYVVPSSSGLTDETQQQEDASLAASSSAIPLTTNIEETWNDIRNNIRSAPIAAASTQSSCPSLPSMVLPLANSLTAPMAYSSLLAASPSLASLFQQQNNNSSSPGSGISTTNLLNVDNPNHLSGINNTNNLNGISNPSQNYLNGINNPRLQELTVAAARLNSQLSVVQQRLTNMSESDFHGNLPDLLEHLSRLSSEIAVSIRMSSFLSTPPTPATTTMAMPAPAATTAQGVTTAMNGGAVNNGIGSQASLLEQISQLCQLSQLGRLGQIPNESNNMTHGGSITSNPHWMGLGF